MRPKLTINSRSFKLSVQKLLNGENMSRMGIINQRTKHKNANNRLKMELIVRAGNKLYLTIHI